MREKQFVEKKKPTGLLSILGIWGLNPEILLKQYQQDLERAASLNAEYVVFHVSDVSIEEGYTYRWLHSNQ